MNTPQNPQNIAQVLVMLDGAARWLNARDVIELLDAVDRWGRRAAARVVFVGGTSAERLALAEALTGTTIMERDSAILWHAFQLVIDDPQAIAGAEIGLCFDSERAHPVPLTGEIWAHDQFASVDALRKTLLETLNDSERRAALQQSALTRVARWSLVELEQFYKRWSGEQSDQPAASAAVASIELTQLQRDVEAEVAYLLQRLTDDFNSLRYRITDTSDLDQFNATVQAWLTAEVQFVFGQLQALSGRVSKDLQRLGLSASETEREAAIEIQSAPIPAISAPELTTRAVPTDDKTRAAVSLGGGGLIVVVSQVLLSQGPVAALATGAAAGLAAYIALGQNANRHPSDPVQTYFDLMERTTITQLRAPIERVGASLTHLSTPVHPAVNTRAGEIGQRLAQIRALLI